MTGGAGGSYGGSYGGGPVAALRRIAFLMERGREETRRIQAFRNAAAVILPLPPDDIVDRAPRPSSPTPSAA
jgi:putative hydrolase